MNSLSLIIPVHNGKSFIEGTLVEYNEFFSKKFDKFEMIVVCNACTDNTEEICNTLKDILPLEVLNEPKRGKGNALIRGFNRAKYALIGFLDDDNPFNLNEVLKMIESLGKNHIVIATKFKKNQLKYQDSLLRRALSIGGSIVSKFLFNLEFTDTQAGAKFMKREVWESLDQVFFCKGFEFDMEFLYRAQKNNFKIKEHFISPRVTETSTVKMRILPGILFRLFKLRLLK